MTLRQAQGKQRKDEARRAPFFILHPSSFILQPSRVPPSGILFFVPRSAGKVRVMSAEVFRRWRRTTKCAGASFSTSLSFPSLTLRFAQGAVINADILILVSHLLQPALTIAAIAR